MNDFWDDEVDDEHTGPPLTEGMVMAAERTLGCKLPDSYLRLLLVRNGGRPRRQCFPDEADSRAGDLVVVETLRGVGYARGVDGPLRFTLRNWGFAGAGLVLVADTPSGGHDFVALDYRQSGPQGEPRVSYVWTEGGADVLVVAPDFATFARGLTDCPRDEDDGPDETPMPARRSWRRFWRSAGPA